MNVFSWSLNLLLVQYSQFIIHPVQMATISSDNTIQTDTLNRLPRFKALAEYSYKSPVELEMTRQSRSPNNLGSRRRRVSHSPVSVNTTYELSENNTQKLWANFEEHLRNSLKRGKSTNATSQLSSSTTPQRTLFASQVEGATLSKNNVQKMNMIPSQNQPSLGREVQASARKDGHYSSKPDYVCKENNFYDTTRSGEKNRLLDEPKLKQLFHESLPDFNVARQACDEKPTFSQKFKSNDSQNHFGTQQSNPMGSLSQKLDGTNLVFSPGSLHNRYNDEIKAQEFEVETQSPQCFTRNHVSLGSAYKNPLLVGDQYNTISSPQEYRDPSYNEFIKNPSRQSTYLLGSNISNLDSTFKGKVQQRIADMEGEIRNASPERLKRHEKPQNGSYTNLEQYLNQHQNQYFNQPTVGLNSVDKPPSTQSFNQSQQFNKTTSRFQNYNNQGTEGSLIQRSRYSPHSFHRTMETFDVFDDIDIEMQNNQKQRQVSRGSIRKSNQKSKQDPKSSFKNSEALNREQFSPMRLFSEDRRQNMEKRVQFDQINQAYHTDYQDQIMLSPGSVSDLRSSQGTAQSFQHSTKPSRKTLKGKNSVTKKALFQDFNPKSKFSISDQPYFSKNWSQASSNHKLGKHNGSKSTYRCETSNELVDTLNESIIKSQQSNLNPQNGDCRRLMMNMVTNLRHQKLHKENQPQNSRMDTSFHDQRNRSPSHQCNRSYNMILQEKYLQQDNTSFAPQSAQKAYYKKTINIKERVALLQAEVTHLQQQASPDYQAIVTKLITCEKLIKSVIPQGTQPDPESLLLRLHNAFLIVTSYQSQQDYLRIIRFLDQNTAVNLNLKEQLTSLSKKHKMRKEISNYVLHIQSVYGNALIIEGKFQKACTVLSELSRLYTRWRQNQYSQTSKIEQHIKNEFGVDDCILVRANEAECFLHCGHLNEAIEKFEKVKRDIKQEVVFDKPLLFINVCNQLGNCYLKVNDQNRALDNFETSLYLIQKGGTDLVGEMIVAKICSNIAQISGNKGYLNDSVKMQEKSLSLKLKVLPQYHQDILSSYLNCAQALQSMSDWEDACKYLNKAFEVSKNIFGEFDLKTATILIQLGQSYHKNNKFADSLKTFEHAGMILSRLEGQRLLAHEAQEIRFNLNKLYLQLVNLYMVVDKTTEAQSIIKTLEYRLEGQYEDESCYKIMNELANILRKHENLPLAVDFYKKALLLLKKKYKNNYLQIKDTTKILINIATSEYLRHNHLDSIKYYQHALQVIQNSKQSKTGGTAADQEAAKVYIQIAHTQHLTGNLREAQSNFNKAIQILERNQGRGDSDVQAMMLEARYSMKQLVDQAPLF